MDFKIEGRLKKFNPHKFNLVNTRSEHKLSLRKNKLETMIFEKRMKTCFFEDSLESQLKIVIKDLNIPEELDDFFESSDDKQTLLLKLLQDNDKDIIKFALKKISKHSTHLNQNDDCDIELENDVFNMIIFYLCEDPDINIKVYCNCYRKYEASFSLINIIYASNSHLRNLIENDVLTNLYNLTFHENLFIVNNIFWIFYNILTQEKDEILGLIPLRKRIKEIFLSSKEIPKFLMTTIISLIKNTFMKETDNEVNFEFAETYLTRIIQFLLNSLSEKQEEDVFWEDSLNYIFHLTEMNEVETYRILQSTDFFQLLFRTDIHYKLEEFYLIFRIIGNLFYNDIIMEKLFNQFDVISFLDFNIIRILNSNDYFHTLSKEICFACSNIAAGPMSFKIMLVQRGMVQKVLSLVQFHTKIQTIKEIASFCFNLLEGASIELITEIYNLKVLGYLCTWLNVSDTETLKYCLKGIDILLDYGNKVKEFNCYERNFVKQEMEDNEDEQVLIKLQYSNVKCIYDLVEEILHKYFDFSEDQIEV